MPRNRLLFVLAVLIVAIFVLHVTAIVFHLYWVLWWYDIIVHFLGGAFAGLLILWLRFCSGYFGAPEAISEIQMFIFSVLAALVIGILWEIFERMLGLTWSVEGYWLDTASDVVFDLVGGIAAFYFFKRKYATYGQKT